MKTIEKTINVYVSDDGREFLDEKSCSMYEKKLDDFNRNIKFFRLDWNPDLNETGCFQDHALMVVYSSCGYHEQLVSKFAQDKLKQPIIGPSVMGYGFQSYFSIHYIKDKEVYKSTRFKKVFILSPDDKISDDRILLKFIPGTFEHVNAFNYIKEWNLK